MVLTVSINGADNVGKTTQIGLLPRHYSIFLAGSLHDSDEMLGQLVKNNKLKDWWWGCTDEEFVLTIFGALGRRRAKHMACEQVTMVVYDRGTAMFEAVAVAVIAVKSQDHDLTEARKKLHLILSRKEFHVPREQVAILLKHGHDLEESVRITLQREHQPADARYRLYQTLLQTELGHQEKRATYQHIILAGLPETHREVQNQLRAVLKPSIQHHSFQPILHNLRRIYAFGGLSEAGKSTFAQTLAVHCGPELAFRAKIAYFNELASERLGGSIYAHPEEEQAIMLLHELENFSNRHYWIKVMTIESLHRVTVTKWLKTWLGNKFQVVFIDASDDKRAERSLVPPDARIRNDSIKQGRGAHLIRGHADFILDNNGTFTDSVKSLLE